jgi:hypothetical protein
MESMLILETLGVIMLFSVSFMPSFAMLIGSIIVISLGFVLGLFQAIVAKSQAGLAVSVSLVALLPPVYAFLARGEAIVWDVKGMENVADAILLNGHLVSQGNNFLPGAYTLYPSSFVLLASLSGVTSLKLDSLFVFPILTLVMYLIILWVCMDIAKLEDITAQAKCVAIAILVAPILVLQSLLSQFIYQNYGWVMLIFFIYLIGKYTILQKAFDPKAPVILLVILAALIPANSDSSIALFVFAAGFSLSGLLLRDETRRARLKQIVKWSTVVLLSFVVYQLFQVAAFTGSLFSMLQFDLANLLNPEHAIGISKYSTAIYDQFQFVLLALSLGVIVVFTSALIIGSVVSSFRIREIRDFAISLGPVVSVGTFAFFLFLATPYAGDTSLKFIVPLSAVLALFYLELSRHAKKSGFLGRYALSKMAVILVIVLFIPGFFVLGGFTDYFSPIGTANNTYTNVLIHSSIGIFLSTSQTANIVDSPDLPAYFVYDYVAHRIPVNYSITVSQPNLISYDFALMNGLMAPRLYKTTTTNQPPTSQFTIVSPSYMQTQAIGDMIYSNGFVAVSLDDG